MSKRFVLAVAGLAAVPTQAQLVMNGGFEQPGTGFQTVLAGQTFGGWTNAGPGDIEFGHAVPSPFLPNLEFSAFEGDYWIDLVGIGAPSAIFQSIDSLQAGDTYRIEWAQSGNVWGPNADFTMSVFWNGVAVATNTQTHGGSDGSNMDWQTYSVDVVALPGSNELRFGALSGGSARGPALDDVSLTLVPAPGTFLALAAAGLVSTRRRRC